MSRSNKKPKSVFWGQLFSVMPLNTKIEKPLKCTMGLLLWELKFGSVFLVGKLNTALQGNYSVGLEGWSPLLPDGQP